MKLSKVLFVACGLALGTVALANKKAPTCDSHKKEEVCNKDAKNNCGWNAGKCEMKAKEAAHTTTTTGEGSTAPATGTPAATPEATHAQ